MKRKLIGIFAGLLTVAVLTVSGTSYAAGSAAFGMSSASATTGSNATVYITEDGSGVSAVTVTYSYDTSKLQFVGSSCAGAFPNGVGGNTCYGSPVNGSQTVMALTFKAVAAGSASVTVTGSTIASNGANEWNGSPASGSITISNPVSTGGGGGSTSSGGHSGSTGSATSSTPSAGSKNQASNTTTATPSSTNATSTTNTSSNNKTSTTTGQVKGASTTKNVGEIVASKTAHKSHLPKVPAVIYYYLLLLAIAIAVYWFIRNYTVAVTVKVSKKVASAPKASKAAAVTKSKSVSSKKTGAKPKKPKTASK